MKKLVLFLGLCLTLLSTCKEADVPPMQACTLSFADSSLRHPLNSRLQSLLNQYVKKGIPGTVLWIRNADGVWVGSAGYADLDKKIPMAPCVVSKVASVTKMLVGTMTMRLWEQGKINLDQKAADFLDGDIVDHVVNLRSVTIRQLMNHTTGIPSPTAQDNFYLAVLNNPDKRWTSNEIIKYIYDVPEKRCCGSQSASYSDANILLLGLVLNKILGYHHSTALHQMVLDPLGMSHTYYFPHDNLPPETARGYFDLYNNGTITDVTNINTGSGNGYGGTYSNVLDISHYLETVWRKKQFLSQAAMDEMMKFVPEQINETNPADTLYLGGCLMKRFTYIKPGSYGIGHTGRDLGYNATAFYFPKEDVTMMMIVNYGTNGKSNLKPVFLEFQDEILKTILLN